MLKHEGNKDVHFSWLTVKYRKRYNLVLSDIKLQVR